MERAWKIVYIPYIVYIHCIHTQYNTQIHTQYSYKVYNKHTWTHVKTDGWIDEQADGGIYIFYIYMVYKVSLHSTHIQTHTQRTYIVYTQRAHGRTDKWISQCTYHTQYTYKYKFMFFVSSGPCQLKSSVLPASLQSYSEQQNKKAFETKCSHDVLQKQK